MIAVNVKGGTGAGTKRPLKERRWTHSCADSLTVWRRTLTSYSCPHCGTRRPTTSEDK